MRLYFKSLIVFLCALTFPLAALASSNPLITISPGYSTIPVSSTLQYAATISGMTNTAVIWEVNGIIGGNSTVGTISSSGLYHAPAAPAGDILIEALESNKNLVAAVYVVVAPRGPALTYVSPGPIPLGTTTITVHGSGFQPGAALRNSIGNLATSYVNSTTLVAIGYVGSTGPNFLQAMNPGGLWGPMFLVYYGTPQTLTPATATLALGASNQFISARPATWSATAGTVTSTGLYTAPATVPTTGATVTVTANSTTGPTHAIVTLISPIGAVLPTTPIVMLGGTLQFSATGATSWTASAGTITSTGLYSAPAKIPTSGSSVTITATGVGGSTSTTATLGAVNPISPLTATVALGKSQQFTALGATSWSATAGTITSGGLYTASATMPSSSTAMISATGSFGTFTATVTLVKPSIQIVSPATASIQIGNSLQFTSPGTTLWSVNVGVVSDTGYYTAPNSLPSNPSVTLTASGPNGVGFATITLTPGTSQTISPANVSVSLGTTQQFTSTGATSWSATAGAISSNGLFSAPSAMPANNTVSITVTGPNGAGTAIVTLINGTAQSISPTSATVTLSTTQQFASVGATSWSASAGSVTSTGLYTAPASGSSATVTATGPNGSATAAITLAAQTAQTISPALATVIVGNTLQFTSPGAISWKVKHGTISSTGLYTAPSGTSPNTDTITATGPLNSATALVTIVALPSLGAITITTDNPLYGWQVIPGATRRIHARVTNGTSNQVSWSYTAAGGATATLTPAPAPNVLGAFVDVTVGSTGSTCTNIGTATNPVFSSASAINLVATSVDDNTISVTVPVNVCNPPVQAYVSPFNVRLYSGQTVNLQSWVWGAVNDNVTWSVSQPSGGNGTFTAPPAGGSATTARDALFSATVGGNYTVIATSVTNPSVSASATISVSGNSMPSYAVTPNHTEPVDCSVDPTLTGNSYDVGPGHTYPMLANAFVAIGSDVLSPGTTIRLFNSDTTGNNPTHFHEYLRIDGQGSQTQPIRIVGCADSAGNLPVMDAADATSYSPTDNSVNANIAGLYQIGLHHSNGFAVYPTITSPSYVVIEGLAFRNAYPTTGSSSNSYYNPGSSTATQWGQSASCIRPYEGNHLTVRGNDMQDCSFGILADFNGNNGWGGFFGDFDLQGNYFTNIGAVNQSEHMAYVQGFRQVVQGNVFDQLKSVSAAGMLKMRGVAEVVRYNVFNSSTNTRTIDFVEEQDSNMYMSFLGYYYTPSGSVSFRNSYPSDTYTPDLIAAGDEAWHKAYAYGNIINMGPATPNSQAPIHFFGDQGQYSDVNTNPPVRVGDLFDYSNTIYSPGNNSLHFVDTMQNQDNQFRWEWPTLNVWNNAMYVGPINNTGAQAFQMSTLRSDIYNLGPNWLSSNWGSNSLTCSINGSGNVCIGTGWPYQTETTQYMDGGNLPAHVFGLSNLITGGSTLPFSITTWAPTSGGGLVGAGAALPSTFSNMPVRFQMNAPSYSLTPRKSPLTLGAHD